MGTIKTTNIETITGSGTLTLGQSGETITIPSGVTITNNGTQTGFGGTNTPAFYAYNSSATSLTNGAYTKVNFQTEILDSDNCFASGTFTPNVAGYYFLDCQVKLPTLNTNHSIILYRNGSQYTNFWDIIININSLRGSCMVYANGTTDYFDVYYYQASGSSQNTTTGQAYTFFSGFKIIE